MEYIYEENITVNENTQIKFIKTDDVANIFINTKEINKVSKSAVEMSFRGLLSLLAFYSNSDHYTVDYEGVVIYNDIINIGENLYLQLEDTLEYYDEDMNDIAKDYDEDFQLTLYSRDNEHEIATFSLDDSVILLFSELEDIKTNTLYQQKLNISESSIRH